MEPTRTKTKSRCRRLFSKKCIVLFIAFVLFAVGTFQYTGWGTKKLIILKWEEGKGLSISLENRSLLYNTKGTFRILENNHDEINGFGKIPVQTFAKRSVKLLANDETENDQKPKYLDVS